MPSTAVTLARTALCCALGAVCAAAQDNAEFEVPRDKTACGAYCLYVSLKALDIAPVQYKDLESRLGAPGELGYSMNQLSEVAGSYGAHVLGLQTSLANLESRRDSFVCLALLKEGHYVVVYDADERSVFFIDPPSTRTLPKNAFGSLWTGQVLLMSEHKIQPLSPYRARSIFIAFAAVILFAGSFWPLRRVWKRKRADAATLFVLVAFLSCGCHEQQKGSGGPPIAELKPRFADLGDVELDRQAEVTGAFALTNVGVGDLHIYSISASCGCTLVKPPRSRVRSGEQVFIRFSVRPGLQPGPRSSTLLILSDDGNRPRLQPEIRWYGRPAVDCDPSSADLGQIPLGGASEALIRLTANGNAVGQALTVSCSDGSLRASIVPNGEETPSRSFQLTLKTVGAGDPGEHRATAMIVWNPDRPSILIPVRWKVVPPVVVAPTALLSNQIGRGELLRETLTLESTDGQPVHISDVRFEPSGGRWELQRVSGSPGVSRIRLLNRAADRLGYHRSRIRIIVRGMESTPVDVPWSVVVTK